MGDEYEHSPTQEGWEDEDVVVQRSLTYVIAQIVLLMFGFTFFLWLVNVLSDDPIVPGLVDNLSEGAWIAILLLLLAIVLLMVIILLRPKWVQRLLRRTSVFDDDPVYMVGCPGCGTTFDRRHHEIDEPHEKRFQCPNCARVGELKSMRRKKATVDDHWCTDCDKHYKVYQDESECPHCHKPQQHAR